MPYFLPSQLLSKRLLYRCKIPIKSSLLVGPSHEQKGKKNQKWRTHSQLSQEASFQVFTAVSVSALAGKGCTNTVADLGRSGGGLRGAATPLPLFGQEGLTRNRNTHTHTHTHTKLTSIFHLAYSSVIVTKINVLPSRSIKGYCFMVYIWEWLTTLSYIIT